MAAKFLKWPKPNYLKSGYMIRINVHKQSNYPIGTNKLKKTLQAFFLKNGIVSDAEVAIAIVSSAKMLEYGKKYLKEKGDKPHNVLSFTPDEAKDKFLYPPDAILHLGEIVICYPCVIKEAKDEGVLIDDKVRQLAEHGATHLMGIHHP